MTDYPYDAPATFTTNPIEGEVSQALALYKIALINASYRNLWHRLSCKMGDKERLSMSIGLLHKSYSAERW
ncbi:hypothetical protein [Cronobacter malonaticus]|uniref:hypothetical protein n=1 Tax=Cronobacter malonaticus TaxID=413503 RepID=UPI000CFBB0C0|nr:hypothetical protein [Cronobacter malonaticus]